MKPIVKELLTEMVQYGKKSFDKKIIEEACKKMEFSDLSNLIGWILHWQKDIKHHRTDNEDFFFNEYMLLDDALQRRYKPFFEYCPVLSEVFQLEGDKITYHPDLTEQDKKEILDFIDKNHEIKIVKVRRK